MQSGSRLLYRPIMGSHHVVPDAIRRHPARRYRQTHAEASERSKQRASTKGVQWDIERGAPPTDPPSSAIEPLGYGELAVAGSVGETSKIQRTRRAQRERSQSSAAIAEELPDACAESPNGLGAAQTLSRSAVWVRFKPRTRRNLASAWNSCRPPARCRQRHPMLALFVLGRVGQGRASGVAWAILGGAVASKSSGESGACPVGSALHPPG